MCGFTFLSILHHAQVHLVLLATGVGDYGRQVDEFLRCFTCSSSLAGPSQYALAFAGASGGLLCIRGEPVVDTWLKAVQQCPRLLPAQEKLTILTGPETHASYVEWAKARGFPAASLLPHPESRFQDPLGDIRYVFKAKPQLQAGYTMLARWVSSPLPFGTHTNTTHPIASAICLKY